VKPRPGEKWTRKRDGMNVIVEKTERDVVTFFEPFMLIQHERKLDVFVRNYRKVFD
jgi:hypothetical protein